MKQCKCGSMAFNLAQEGVDQGDLCDRHYWQDRAEQAEASVAMLRTGDTCARHCEGTAYRIEARRLQRWSDELRAALFGEHKDAARYRLIRRGQHWSVIDGIGDTLRANDLDAAVDAVIAKGAP